MKKIVLLFILTAAVILSSNSHGQSSEQGNVLLGKASQQFFIENKGQWPEEVLYLTRMGGLDAWITKKGVLYTFYKLEEITESASSEKQIKLAGKFDEQNKEYSIIGHRVWAKLQNANPSPGHEGKQKKEGYYNYFIGNDPGKHASNVGLYKEALVTNVYTGIDVRYYFDKGNLRYDYIVHPGADYRQIQVQLEGAISTAIKDKDLVFTTRFGEVKQAELYVYQEQENGCHPIAASWQKKGESYGFALSHYDPAKPLVIDPLIYSTYIGGSGAEYGNSIAIDASGCAYVTGYTNSSNYEITPGAFQSSYGGGFQDVFVTKFNATGSALIYSTYIGGSEEDRGYSIAVDVSGNAYVTGYTRSSNYDITPGAFQSTRGGSYDVFVTKLNATGSALIYSTYIGGSNEDLGYSIVIDVSGNAYVTGQTLSDNYDITPGAFQSTMEGWIDAFVTKLNATGSALIYSTYLGGSDEDRGYSIAIDASGNAYVTGLTRSDNYDIIPGAFQSTMEGYYDVFVTKLNAAGTALIYSTYIGGSNADKANSIAIDASGCAYVTGQTWSSNFDITPGAFQSSYGGGDNDVFVTKLNATGSELIYSTYIGGSVGDVGYSIAIEVSGNAYVTGATSSSDYDITPGAFQSTYGGGFDVFVSKLNTDGTALVYSTYIGGSTVDYGTSIAIVSGDAYLTGGTASSNYDITPGAFQSTFGGDNDVFVTKLFIDPPAGIQEPGAMENLTVYPNPNNGTFTISGASEGQYSVINELGQTVREFELNAVNNYTVPIKNLSTGVYYIVGCTKNENMQQKIVVTE